MNFNIYLDSALGQALQRLAKRRKMTRNALIRKAVEEFVNKENHSQDWSNAVLQWQGDPGFESFESHRARLRAPSQDPLA
jgi:predicted transcriptional regulator